MNTFWYIYPTPTKAGFDWLLTEPLYMQLLGKDGSVLAYDENQACAAILDTITFIYSPDEFLTVNNQIINWGKSYPALRALLQDVRDIGPTPLALHYLPSMPLSLPISFNPLLAPGQKENNVVNPLDCGHEVDTEEELPEGSEHYCSMHGWSTVIRPTSQ